MIKSIFKLKIKSKLQLSGTIVMNKIKNQIRDQFLKISDQKIYNQIYYQIKSSVEQQISYISYKLLKSNSQFKNDT